MVLSRPVRKLRTFTRQRGNLCACCAAQAQAEATLEAPWQALRKRLLFPSHCLLSFSQVCILRSCLSHSRFSDRLWWRTLLMASKKFSYTWSISSPLTPSKNPSGFIFLSQKLVGLWITLSVHVLWSYSVLQALPNCLAPLSNQCVSVRRTLLETGTTFATFHFSNTKAGLNKRSHTTARRSIISKLLFFRTLQWTPCDAAQLFLLVFLNLFCFDTWSRGSWSMH